MVTTNWTSRRPPPVLPRGVGVTVDHDRGPVSDADLAAAERFTDELVSGLAALQRYVRSLVAPDRHRAEDIVQETLLRAWQHGDRITRYEGPLRPWLFRTARNLAIDAWRKDRTVPIDDLSVLGEPADPANPADLVTDRRVLVDGLRRLPAVQLEILVHVHLFGHATDDVARTLDIPSGTVKSRTYHAVRALRRVLQEVA